jgi:cardiolipin synthase
VALSFADEVRVHIPKSVTVMVLSRDVIIVVSAIAIAFVSGRKAFSPTGFGKASTAAQMLCVAVAFAANSMRVPKEVLDVVFVVTGALTVGSGLHYLYRASSRRFVEPVADRES